MTETVAKYACGTPVLLWVLLGLVLSGCTGQPEGEGREVHVPYVQAPLDTGLSAGAGHPAARDTTWIASHARSITEWPPSPPAGFPPLEALVYTRYTNPAYGYSLLYPDTLLKPQGDIGQSRGQEFSSTDGRVVMITYAREEASPEMLEDQYQTALDDPRVTLTYTVRDQDWYVVSGSHVKQSFYEKKLYRNGMLKTFRMQYPRTHEDYFGVVAATIAASFGE